MTVRSFGLVCGFLLGSGILAAVPRGPVGLDVSPSLLDLPVVSGEPLERTVTLSNPGDEPLAVAASAHNWSMSESGEVRFDEGAPMAGSCAAWIAVEPSRMTVPAKGQVTAKVRIRPAAEMSGARWAVVFFQLTDTAGSVDGRRMTFAPRVGLTIYLTAEGTKKSNIEFSEAAATEGPDGIRLKAVFVNRGNTVERIRLTWQLKSSSGAVAGTQTVTAVSLPGGRRESVTSPGGALPEGTYKATAMARWGHRLWKAHECELVVGKRRTGVSS